jgi:hypothetical protein
MSTALAAGGTLDTVLNAPAVFVLIGGLCFVFGAYIIGIPLLRLAKAMEVRNGLIDGGAAVRKALPKIQDRIVAATDAVRGEVAGHVDDLKATDAVIAGAVNQVAEVAGVTPPEDTIRIAGLAHHRMQNPEGYAGYDWAPQEEIVAARRGAVHGDDDHTGAVRPAVASLPPAPIRLDLTTPNAGWESMLARINQVVPGAMPWHIDPQTKTWTEGPFTFYDMERAQYPALPRDMHEYWPELRQHHLWLNDHPQDVYTQ